MLETSGTVGSTEELGAFAGSLLGDYSTDLVPEIAEAPDASTPSLPESPETPDVPDVPVEGAEPVEPASTPSLDAPAAVPDAAAPPFDPETAFASDPVLTYTVNGVEKSHAGIHVVDGAGYIKPSALPDIQRKLGERDHLVDVNQALYAQSKQFGALTYTDWPDGPKGAAKEYRGVQAFGELMAARAANDASGRYLLKTLLDSFPGDEQKAAVIGVIERAELEGRVAAHEARQKFGTTHQQTVEQGDVGANRDKLFNENFQRARQALPSLTDADEQEAREIYGGVKSALYRPATAEDVARYGYKLGEELYDPARVNAWLTKRAAQNMERVAADKASAKAIPQNANRLAQVRTPAPAVVAPTRRRAAVKDERASDADDAWDLRERLASARMGA